MTAPTAADQAYAAALHMHDASGARGRRPERADYDHVADREAAPLTQPALSSAEAERVKAALAAMQESTR